MARQDNAEDDDASGGPDPTAGSQGTSGGDTSEPAPAGGGRGDSSGGADT